MSPELDLFGPSSTDTSSGALTVSAVTGRAKQLVEAGFRVLWVKGEVASFKAYRSGHWYFTLRDELAQVRCVMWRDNARRLPAQPVEGIQVFVECRPTLWEERGEFRLTVRRMIATEADGLWELQLQRARDALERDGLLDPARRRNLPRFPMRIAVVTSTDGAALRDIASVLGRRWPAAELLVVPAQVQGDKAEQQLCSALELADRIPGVDVIIVGRGGGSREDLWAFNAEAVARTVADMRTPTVSAVGHETDIALTDLVADLRAPTPSAAAETVAPSRKDALHAVDHLARRLAHSLANRTIVGRERLERTGDRLLAAVQGQIERRERRLGELAGRLHALSPLRVLQRGYAVARNDQGQVLKTVRQFATGQRFRLTVQDGDITAVTERGGST
jgi:exodeoxyribonuclease VII large subunit